MSRDHPILLPATPEAASSVRTTKPLRFHDGTQSSPEITVTLHNDVQIIDLAQDDDEVIQMDDSEEEEERETNLAEVVNDSANGRIHSRGRRSFQTHNRVLQESSNCLNRFQLGDERFYNSKSVSKRMNKGNHHQSFNQRLKSSSTSDQTGGRGRFHCNHPFDPKRPTSAFLTSTRPSTSYVRHRPNAAASRDRNHVDQPLSMRHDFMYHDFGMDEFEALPPPEPPPEDLASIVALGRGTPAPEHIVSQLPIIAVQGDEVCNHSGAGKKDHACAICWEDYAKGDHRKLLPCLHSFHDVCLDQWLAINGSCPICKHRIQ